MPPAGVVVSVGVGGGAVVVGVGEWVGVNVGDPVGVGVFVPVTESVLVGVFVGVIDAVIGGVIVGSSTACCSASGSACWSGVRRRDRARRRRSG